MYYLSAGTRSSRLGMTPGSATCGSQTIVEEDEFDKLVDLVRKLYFHLLHLKEIFHLISKKYKKILDE